MSTDTGRGEHYARRVLTVAVLGPLEVRRDGALIPVPAGKTSELAVRLALDVGSVLRVDTLVEDLWGRPTARNTVQSKVSQLRRVLGVDVVIGSPLGYRLALPAEAVDAARVQQLATTGVDRAVDRPEAVFDRASAGLALFRGPVLPAAGDWAIPERARLEEIRLRFTEELMTARLDLGAGGELVADLERLVDQHPLRERCWEALILALYRSGRQADALAAYDRVRRLLDAELGVEPGPGLAALQRQVLRQEAGLITIDAAALTTPGNISRGLPDILGRAADLEAVRTAIQRSRLVTILGPGGVGKTRLAYEIGGLLSAAGGVWLIRLDAVDARTDLHRVTAETLRIASGDSALHERLRGADTVLIFDNCEHVINQVLVLVETLLDAAPGLRIVTTSQVPLGSPLEHEHVLVPLAASDAVELFIRRARQRRNLEADEETRSVVEHLCRALDGLPLAIELAAARVRSLSIRELAHRLDDRFTVLRDPDSPRDDRRRTLAGAISWSYQLLFPDDQRALWALSCFSGGASLPALETVMAALGVPAEASLDTIDRLVGRSMVVVDTDDDDAVRYRLLDSIRAYAASRSAEAGVVESAQAAHACWFAELAVRCEAEIRTERQAGWVVVARTERTNIDAALAWCAEHDPQLGLQLVLNWGWAWVVLGDGTAAAARIRGALVEDASVGDRLRAFALAAWLEASAGDVARAQADLDHAQTLVAQLDDHDDRWRADLDRHRAFVAIQQGRVEVALSTATSSLAVYRARRDSWGTAAALLLRGFAALMAGEVAAAKSDVTKAQQLLVPLGDAWGRVHADAMQGAIAEAEHRFADAAGALARAATLASSSGFAGQAALHLASLGRVQLRAGDGRAAQSLVRAVEMATANGDGRLAATARLHLARLSRAAGDLREARSLLARNEDWYARAGGGGFALMSRCLWATITDDAELLADVLAQSRREQQTEVEVLALDALARLALDGDARQRAQELLAAADHVATTSSQLDDQLRVDAAEVRRRLR